VRLTPIEDEHEAEYWVRQIRFGTGVAVGVTLLAMVRVVLDWPAELRWWLVPLAVAAAAQGATLGLRWGRIVRRPHMREFLFTWWLAELPLIYMFAAKDQLGVAVYVAAVTLLLMLAAALYPPLPVVGLGAVSLVGLAVLILDRPQGNTAAVVVLGAALATTAVVAAVTAQNRYRQDAHRRSTERRTELLLENASDAVLAIGPDGAVTYASPAVRTVLGHAAEGLRGARFGALVHPDDVPRFGDWITALAAGRPGGTDRVEVRVQRADGTVIYVDILGRNRTDDPDLSACVLGIRDISSRRALEIELTRQAFCDSLTGLANRALFRDRLAHTVARLGRGGTQVAVILVDLDDFKMVNDSLGHSAGDRLLTIIAERLKAHVRPGDTLARLGGDEFALIVENLDEFGAAQLAERVLAVTREPIRLDTRDVVCTMSVGVAVAKAGDDCDTEELLRNADLAMYAAKRDGRDRFAVFDPAMYTDLTREAQQRADLERALEDDQFVLYFQPIVDLTTRRLVGVEALVRWRHPVEGLVGPDTFIPIAEATGLIVPLGRWIIRQAVRQLAQWHRDNPDTGHLRMSINVSGRQFQGSGLVEEVTSVLAETGVDPKAIVLEITESMLMQDVDATALMLQALRDLGVRVAVDDFGTGYSSLSYLKRFPVDILKVDRSFVGGHNAGDTTLADAVLGLGRALQLQTVAEGIETDTQWSTMRDLGYDYGQGYLFARPAAAVQIDQLMADPTKALPAP
jgi:diguanylate cyclase (GGDEF)-like protein/PAS domain S-box-containing protein